MENYVVRPFETPSEEKMIDNIDRFQIPFGHEIHWVPLNQTFSLSLTQLTMLLR